MSNPIIAKIYRLLAVICTIATLLPCCSSPAKGAWGYIDEKQHKVIYPEHGYIDCNGKVAFKCPDKTDSNEFTNGHALITSEDTDQPHYYVNKVGMIVSKRFMIGESFSEGLAGAGQTGKVGFIDAEGKFAIAPYFQNVEAFREGLAAVEVNRKYGFIDKSGALVIDPFFDRVASFAEGLAAVQAEGKIGFIDKLGIWKIKPQFDFVEGFAEGLTLVTSGQDSYYIDKLGNIVIRLDKKTHTSRQSTDGISRTSLGASRGGSEGWGFQHYRSTPSSFSEGLAVVVRNNKEGYLNKSGNPAIAAKFDEAYPFKDGIARVRVGTKYGFIDKTGSYTIIPKFKHARDFCEGAAAVAVAPNKWGYISKTGQFLIKPKYSYARSFSEGLANVQFSGYHPEAN
jgi:hypothetical protein